MDIFYYPSIAPLNQLRLQGINCAGFINLLIHYSGKEIPPSTQTDIPRGGTGHWYHILSHNNVHQPNLSYPIGTLPFRKYRCIVDQGHMAVVISEINEVIHAYTYNTVPPGGVGITPIVNHLMTSDYYDFTIAQEHWILNQEIS